MMEEEEETLFDQERLLNHKEEIAHERRQWKHKLLKTATLSMSFFCLGLCIAIPGPTLLDLGKRVNHDTEHMTFIFTARSIGYLLGAVVGGVLFDFFNQQILLFYTISAAALATASIPWCASLLALSAFICVQGVAMGVLDSGGNVYCIRIWGQKSAPFMQILHFAFGVGAFLAPLIARPFLMDMTMASDNITSTGYYPVNFKVLSLKDYNRPARDVDVVLFQLARQYELDSLSETFVQSGNNAWLPGDSGHDGSVPATHGSGLEQQKISGSDKGNHPSEAFHLKLPKSQRKDFPYSIEADDTNRAGKNYADVSTKTQYSEVNVRVKRQLELPDSGDDLKADNSSQQLGNGTDGNTTSTAAAITTVPPPTAPRAKKPDFSPGAALNPDASDASDTDAILKDLRKNPPVQNVPPPQEVTTAASTPADLDLTSLANATELLSNTSLSQGTNNTDPTEDAATVSTATTTTTEDTTTTATTTTSTTTDSTTTPTTTASTTTSTTLSPTTPQPPPAETTRPSTEQEPKPTEPNLNVPSNSSPDKSLDAKAGQNLSTTNSTASPLNVSAIEDDLFSNIITTFTGMSKIQMAYALIGMLLVTNAGLFLFLYCKDRLLPQSPAPRSHEDLTRPPDTKCFICTIVILLFFFFFSYVGMEVTYGGLLTTFAVYYPLNFWDSAQAATLTAFFWGSIALGRCLSIFIACCFKPPFMMVTNLCFTILGALLLSFTVQTSSAMLWVGTVILGLGMSSLFPTTISWANSYYPLTGRATAVFVAGSGIGEMVIPVLTGYLFDKVSRMAVMYMTLVLSSLMCVLYLGLQLLVFQKGRTRSRRSHSGFMRLNNSEDMADAVDMDAVDMVEGGATAEAVRRRRLQDENGKFLQNGDSYSTTEFTKLVELSD